MSTRIFAVGVAMGLVVMVSPAQNVSVNYNGGSGSPVVVGPDGTTALANGNDVELGYFSGFDPTANGGNLSALAAARQSGEWHLFGSTTIQSSFLLPPGSFSASSSEPGAAGFTGNQIDLWIFQTVGQAPPAADLSNVTAWGIFSSTINISPSRTWVFPAPSIGGVDNITTADLTGGNGIFSHGQLSPGGNIEVTGVPEPSTAALSALGVALSALVFRRANRASK